MLWAVRNVLRAECERHLLEASVDADGHQGEYRSDKHRCYSHLSDSATREMAAAAITLKCITIPAVAKHTATVVFVHVSISSFTSRFHYIYPSLLYLFQGLGDTGHGWKPVADMFKADPGLAHVKWVLPHSYV